MSTFFELYVIAVFISQIIFDSETSISLIGSANSNPRLFWLAHVETELSCLQFRASSCLAVLEFVKYPDSVPLF